MEHVFPRVFEYIDSRFKSSLKMPNSFSKLQEWINDACIYIETSDKNSNKTRLDPTKMGTVNAISFNEYPDLYNSQSINQFTQHGSSNSSYNNKYNQQRQFDRNTSRGSRGNYR